MIILSIVLGGIIGALSAAFVLNGKRKSIERGVCSPNNSWTKSALRRRPCTHSWKLPRWLGANSMSS